MPRQSSIVAEAGLKFAAPGWANCMWTAPAIAGQARDPFPPPIGLVPRVPEDPWRHEQKTRHRRVSSLDRRISANHRRSAIAPSGLPPVDAPKWLAPFNRV